MQTQIRLTDESLRLLESIAGANVREFSCDRSSMKRSGETILTVANRLITDKASLYFSSHWLTLGPQFDVFLLEVTPQSPLLENSAPTEWESVLKFGERANMPTVAVVLIGSSVVGVEETEAEVDDEVLISLSNGSLISIRASDTYPTWLETAVHPASSFDALCKQKHCTRKVA